MEDGVGEGDDVLYLVDYLAASHLSRGFPGGSEGKESACDSGDPGSISGSGRSPGEENGNPLQYSMNRGAWQATVHGVTKNQTQLSYFHLVAQR